MILKRFILALILLQFAASILVAAEIVLQNNEYYSGCSDSYIKSQRPDENCGNEDKIGCKFERCYA